MQNRILLTVTYDGSAFHGWQVQGQGICTVQEHLETALSKIAKHPVQTIVAGRTDTGVHATAQMVHFDTNEDRPLSAWVRGVNAFLPAQMSVLHAQKIAPEFNARFDAYSRRYRYVLSNEAIRPTILSGKVGWSFWPLDVQAMHQAAQHLLGQHDFSSFRASQCQAKSPIKTMTRLDVYQNNGFICFDFEANAFLHHMVRNLVGALVYVGSHRLSEADFVALLHAKNRTFAPPTFMADGLYLTGVDYPEHYQVENLPMPAWLWGKNKSI